jgi:DeoR family deoxyribose operon repressor
MFESAKGVEMIRSVRANKAFIAASGVSSKLGVTCSDISEVETKKAVIASSSTRILVADSSKFGEVRVAHFAELEEFDIVVTDAGIPGEYEALIREKGLRLYTV